MPSGKQKKIFLWTVALTSIALLILGACIEPTEQEAYYWLWAKHPALSYFDHPPLQAWTTYLLTKVFGDESWVVRLPATLGHLLLIYLVFRWTRRKYDESSAWWATIIFCTSILVSASGLVALPDVLMLPLAVLSADFSEQRKSTAAGVALGLAMLAKWHASMLVPGIMYCYLARRPSRDLRGLIRVGIVSLLFQIPVVIWNSENGWPAFYYHFVERHQRDHISIQEFLAHGLNYAADQLLLLGFVWVGIVFVVLRRYKNRVIREPKPQARSGIPVWWWILPMLLVFGVSAVRGEYRFYWTGWILIPLAGWLGTKVAQMTSRDRSRVFISSQAVTLINTSFIILVLALPIGTYFKSSLERLHIHYDMRLSPRGDFYGWEEWCHKMLASNLGDPSSLEFDTSNFRIAARLAWALRAEKSLRFDQIATVGRQHELAFWPKPNPQTIKTIIFVADNRRKIPDKSRLPCTDAVVWKTDAILLSGRLVKTIDWAVCLNASLASKQNN